MRGHVRKRGQKWCFVVDLPRLDDEKRRQKWFYGYATRREAEAALAETLNRLRTGAYVAPTRQTFAEFVRRDWLPAIRTTVRPSTFESYDRNLRLHVLPRIGGVRLMALDAPILNKLYSDLLSEGRRCGTKKGLSARTVQYLHTIIHRALRDAVRWDRIARNAADAADPPKPRTSDSSLMRTWDARTVRSFLEATADDRLAALWLLLVTTGLRRGEALGLRWSDIDVEARTASIRQTLITVGDDPAFGTPKTAKGTRVVALDAGTVAALKAHKARQAQERLLLGSSYVDVDLVFAAPDGTPLHPKRVSETFRRRVARLKLPRLSMHGLRHTHATLALEAGVHPKVVSERLGHADVGITLNTYSHVTPTMQADAAETIARLIQGLPTA